MENLLVAMIVAATPFLFAATGELVAERSGVLNLGLEGMMLMGAVVAFMASFQTGNSTIAVLAGAGAGAGMALLFGVLALSFLANQPAVGLALTIFGIGASGLIGRSLVGEALEPLPKLAIPYLSDGWAAGRVLLHHDAMVYLALALVIGVAWFLYRTRAGLALRAIGHDPQAGHALGYQVIRIRYLATIFGGALAGLGGAYMSLSYTPLWGENMTAGRGWISLALVVFATWRPGRLVAGAYLFAIVTQFQFYGHSVGSTIPSQFLAMAPYLATVIALVLISRDIHLTKVNAPASIGMPFRVER